MHRFFINPDCINGSYADIQGPTAKQITRVLRLEKGEHITLFDNTGWAYLLVIETVSGHSVTGNVVDKTFGTGNPIVPINIYQGLLKNDKFEFLLQKGTELGVSCFMPISTQRSIPRIKKTQSQSRYTRWQK